MANAMVGCGNNGILDASGRPSKAPDMHVYARQTSDRLVTGRETQCTSTRRTAGIYHGRHVNAPTHVNPPVHVKHRASGIAGICRPLPSHETSMPTNDAGTAEMTPAVKTAGPVNQAPTDNAFPAPLIIKNQTGEGGRAPLSRRC